MLTAVKVSGQGHEQSLLKHLDKKIVSNFVK